MALTSVNGKTAGAWVDTSAASNIVVGVKGGSYDVQFHLGATPATPDGGVYSAGKPNGGITTVAKASAVRVVNTGSNAIGYEMLL